MTAPSRLPSVECKLAPPVSVIHELRLTLFFKHTRLEHQHVHLGPHEATIAVFDRAHYGLASDIKARIDDHRTGCPRVKSFDDLPIKRICFAAHGLDARGIIDVRDGWNFRAGDVELLDAP